MNKQKFFCDLDSTITNSVLAYTKVYNKIYQYYPDFKIADPNKLKQYNLKDICPLVNNPLDIFDHDLFFKYLEFINDNTYEVLERLSGKYQLIVTSIGRPKNLSKKALFLEEKLPFIKDYILLFNDGCKANKSIINMENGIFIDDMSSNLISSNAKIKILYGKRFEWNIDWDKDWVLNWSAIEDRFL